MTVACTFQMYISSKFNVSHSKLITDLSTAVGLPQRWTEKKSQEKKSRKKSHGKKVTGNKVTGENVTIIKDQEKIHIYQ